MISYLSQLLLGDTAPVADSDHNYQCVPRSLRGSKFLQSMQLQETAMEGPEHESKSVQC